MITELIIKYLIFSDANICIENEFSKNNVHID